MTGFRKRFAALMTNDKIGKAVRRALVWIGNRLRAEKEPPVVAVRDWLKIIIPAAAGFVALCAFLQQAKQLRAQSVQLELSARSANFALADRLSAQLVAIENERLLLGVLESSFHEMTRMQTSDFFDGKEINKEAIERARKTIDRVQNDRNAVEAATHALPFAAFRAVRKLYDDTSVVESFAHDLAGLEKDGIWEVPKNRSPEFMQMLKKDGYPPPHPYPRFGAKWTEVTRDALSHLIQAAGQLQTAQQVTEEQWAEIEKTIKQPLKNSN